jgi:two-component system response regulator MprA
MPGIDGLAVTRRLRAKRLPVPILLLTARDALEERVAGLDAGADDYLVKPFEIEELTARVRALLRRNQPAAERLAFSDLALDPETARARRGDREIALTRREAQLLELLLRNARTLVTREAALEEVWGGELEAGANVVDRYVAYLRRKLGEPPLIHTVRGLGFRLDGA